MKNLFLIMLLAVNYCFAVSYTDIRLSHSEASYQIVRQINANTPKEILRQTINFLVGVLGGARHAAIDFQVGEGTGVKASVDVYVNTSGTAGDVLSIGGTEAVMTAVNYASTAAVNQFNIGSTAALSVAALNTAINASSYWTRYVTSAVSAVSTVTLTAVKTGTVYNYLPFSTSNTTRLSISAASLSGGVNPSSNTYHYGY